MSYECLIMYFQLTSHIRKALSFFFVSCLLSLLIYPNFWPKPATNASIWINRELQSAPLYIKRKNTRWKPVLLALHV